MKRPVFRLTNVFCFVCLSVMTAWACGDKLLFLSRIYRQHGGSGNTVAVYARPHSLLESASAEELSKPFHEEGYRLLLVNNAHDLAMAFQSHAPDVVIADMADVPAVEKSAAAARIPVIPVVDKNNPASASAARHFIAVIKSPVKTGKFLDALDRAFESKEMREEHAKVQTVAAAFPPK